MSTQNTPVMPAGEVPMATEEQLGHILDVWKRRLKGRRLTCAEAQALITAGDRYLPVMDRAADLLIDQVRSGMADTIVRTVRNIRRNRTARQAINDTCRTQYVTSDAVDTMPVGEGPEEVELTYFRLDRFVTDDELEREYESRGLVPDPQAQAVDNEADPAFADKHPNGTHWKNKSDQWCLASFHRGGGKWCVSVLPVSVVRHDDGWRDDWWFAGRKP